MENWKTISGFEAYQVSDLGRVAKATEEEKMKYQELVSFCGGNEGQAYYLSKQLDYRELTEAQFVDAVCNLFVAIKTQAERRPPVSVEYLGGIRRDTLR